MTKTIALTATTSPLAFGLGTLIGRLLIAVVFGT